MVDSRGEVKRRGNRGAIVAARCGSVSGIEWRVGRLDCWQVCRPLSDRIAFSLVGSKSVSLVLLCFAVPTDYSKGLVKGTQAMTVRNKKKIRGIFEQNFTVLN